MTISLPSVSQSGRSRYLAPLVSGLLLGVSFPSYPFIRLELLAWVALVPLLLSLRTANQVGDFFRRVWPAMLLYCIISLWWVSLATLPGGMLTIIAQAFFLTLPFFAFYGVKKMAGYRFALLSFPFLAVAWEWVFMQQELSFGWLTFGNSQANLNLMVQYAEFTGVWGISFWLLWFNVLVVMALTGNRKEAVRCISLLAVMVMVPLLYASWLLHDEGLATSRDRGQLKVTLVQPNIDPHGKWVRRNSIDIMERYYRITEKALRDNHPDLIIWPETAIPFYIFDHHFAYDLYLLRGSLQEWHTSLLTGFVDMQYRNNEPYESYNASMLLEPGNNVPQVYRKMRLVPFGERVPYIDYFPWLGNASFSLSGIRGWGKGRDAVIMNLAPPTHDEVALANIICYESVFPALVAEFVAKGAQLLTLVTNDGWYATSYGPYQHLAIARLRCIENRRAMARCANTGLTVVLDKFGRTIAEIPWWQEQTLTAEVPLESRLSVYTRYPDLLPKGASVISGVLLIAALSRSKRRSKVRSS